jgi:transcriptional regulator with XRE-family HTH domain
VELSKKLIGQNIKAARSEKGLTQSALAKLADISQTQLSDYENGNKMPGLPTIAKIAAALKKSIDELCYGDASASLITSAQNKGRAAANCIHYLWEQGLIGNIPRSYDVREHCYNDNYEQLLYLSGNFPATNRLLAQLDDFQQHEHTYKNPDLFLDQLLDSAANDFYL